LEHDRSEKRAVEILNHYVNTVSKEFNEYIEAIMLVGSLSNGSYIEGPGRDVDVITVIKDTTQNDISKLILAKIDEINSFFNYDVPISKTVYKLNELKRPFKTEIDFLLENKHLIEVTTELFRIHESGILLYGSNIINELPVPIREEVIYFNRLSRHFTMEELSKNPQISTILDNPPMNILVQIIITNAFKHYYYSTNKSCSNKHEIANKMKHEVRNYRFQNALDLATKYKINPYNELSKLELDELKREYFELKAWIDTEPVDSVPLYI